MTAITTPLRASTTSTLSAVSALRSAVGHLFATTDAAPLRPRPARSLSYYESGLAGRERFRL